MGKSDHACVVISTSAFTEEDERNVRWHGQPTQIHSSVHCTELDIWQQWQLMLLIWCFRSLLQHELYFQCFLYKMS
jgi:hypothetical protein